MSTSLLIDIAMVVAGLATARILVRNAGVYLRTPIRLRSRRFAVLFFQATCAFGALVPFFSFFGGRSAVVMTLWMMAILTMQAAVFYLASLVVLRRRGQREAAQVDAF